MHQLVQGIPMPQGMSPTSKQVQQTMLKDFLQQVVASYIITK